MSDEREHKQRPTTQEARAICMHTLFVVVVFLLLLLPFIATTIYTCICSHTHTNTGEFDKPKMLI